MAGAFRGGHMRPTFDTPVEFISVNQTATDKSGGYGSPQITRGEWSAPEVMTEQTVKSRDAFVPTGDSGVQATNLGMFAWYIDGETQVLLFQSSANINQDFVKTRVYIPSSERSDFENANIADYTIRSNTGAANRNRNPLPLPRFIRIYVLGNFNRGTGLPPISYDGTFSRNGILIDDATGQSLYYCNDQLTPPRCEHYRRSIDDGTGPASRTYMADVKDIASAERVVGDLNVATTTKSLVFAHATLRPLMESGSLAKDWKVRIGGRDMDITQVMDGWVPNRYARLVVEDRS